MGREPIRVTRSVSLDPDEIELRVSRSSGPGGQHANKAATRVEAVFDVEYGSDPAEFCPTSNSAAYDFNSIAKTDDLFDVPYDPCR